MIMTRLNGGLGNQMFQYAIARRIAHDRSQSLRLDIASFATDPKRTYRLHHFTIQGNLATASEIALFRCSRLDYRLNRWLRRHWFPEHQYVTVRERRSFQFTPEVLAIPGNLCLWGYWQNEKYFLPIRTLLRQEFTPAADLDSTNATLAGQMQHRQSVSLHIRRGDYVSDPETRAIHNVVSLSYYHAAIQKIIRLVAEPHFFVFSDEPEWLRENLRLDYPMTVVNNGSAKDYLDLWLLSQCQHHIIANSSFSWWGAWLSNTPGKVVIAPAKWINQPGVDAIDVIPASWHTIECE